MSSSIRTVRQVSSMALALAAAAAVQADTDYRNLTAGGVLRPGVYGRIQVRSASSPPPVIYKQPVLANETLDRVQREPVYLYVPPGQVRKWKQNCARWAACDQPVLFVKMEQSPSRWGQWRQLRDQLALREQLREVP